ncbi:MAG: ATP-binding cassette domain-containing protein, partial [Spirochaetales bacterium]|nr:ATP-binding cassette domain-containing protein [Spirochaetales bacterium]
RLGSLMVGEDVRLPGGPSLTTRKAGPVALEVRDLSLLGERGVLALKNLSFSVKQGEIFGLAGVSGNGQKELVEVFMGLHDPSHGSIFLHGEPFHSQRPYLLRHGLAVLPELPLQNAGLANLSVWENLSIHEKTYRPRELKARAEKLRQLFGIRTANLDLPLRSLSGGNIQRTVLARELRSDVKILIVANPCFGLDFQATAEVRSRISEACSQGAAVLLISEDLDEVLELSDRVGVVSEGSIVWENQSSNLNFHELARAMGGHGGRHED